VTPDGSEPTFEEIRVDNTLLKALIKAHLWARELKRGKYSSIQELAEKKNISQAYVRRILNLYYLAPKIQETIIDGKQPKGLRLQNLMADVPLSWNEQKEKFL
jgi:hypothetical protein